MVFHLNREGFTSEYWLVVFDTVASQRGFLLDMKGHAAYNALLASESNLGSIGAPEVLGAGWSLSQGLHSVCKD